MISAAVRPLDHQRAGRILMGWYADDKDAVDLVLAEAQAEPAGIAGLLFTFISFTALFARDASPDDVEAQVEAMLLVLSMPADESPDDAA